MKWLTLVVVVVTTVQLASTAPLRLLRIRNMTFLFVETPDGERVDVLYAPTGKLLGSLPLGSVRGGESDDGDARDGHEESPSVPDDEYDPELDAPRVEPSVIQAPRTKSGCGTGHRKDKHGKCRLIW